MPGARGSYLRFQTCREFCGRRQPKQLFPAIDVASCVPEKNGE